MKEVKYFVFPAGKPEEKFEVLPHTFSSTEVSFAKANLTSEEWASPETLYTWENEAQDGAFVNNEIEQLDVTGTFDIVKEETETELSEESVVVEETEIDITE